MPRRNANRPLREPTLEEILSDPIVRAVMQADGVEPGAVATMVRRIALARRSDPASAERGA